MKLLDLLKSLGEKKPRQWNQRLITLTVNDHDGDIVKFKDTVKVHEVTTPSYEQLRLACECLVIGLEGSPCWDFIAHDIDIISGKTEQILEHNPACAKCRAIDQATKILGGET